MTLEKELLDLINFDHEVEKLSHDQAIQALKALYREHIKYQKATVELLGNFLLKDLKDMEGIKNEHEKEG